VLTVIDSNKVNILYRYTTGWLHSNCLSSYLRDRAYTGEESSVHDLGGGSPKERDNLEEGLHGRVILKWILNNPVDKSVLN